MCTVSFVNYQDTFIITSNRDEKTIRPKAIAPQTYTIKSKKVFFPKDPLAGGTWYAVNENGAALVLLNGAAEKHIPSKNYTLSRGLVVLDLISEDAILSKWETILLEKVEPFTLVLLLNKKLYQLRWDGNEKETKNLPTNKNHIWSSSTLYSNDIRNKRKKWFSNFLQNKKVIHPEDMINFHSNTEIEDLENGLIIDRDAKMKTQSITQTVIEKNKIQSLHIDLLDQQKFENTILLF